jgi:Cu+-exporting ATPase
MLTRRTALLATLACLATASAQAASPVAYTTIQVHDMHCQDCAKKIARKLYAVPGVVEVRADVQKNIAYVVPQQGKSLPPRQLWEAVEASGFKVARLSGPSGTFATKPR